MHGTRKSRWRGAGSGAGRDIIDSCVVYAKCLSRRVYSPGFYILFRNRLVIGPSAFRTEFFSPLADASSGSAAVRRKARNICFMEFLFS